MRLSQLARTLKITQAEIIEFLAQSGRQETGVGAHVRLEEKIVNEVVAHFRPGMDIDLHQDGDHIADAENGEAPLATNADDQAFEQPEKEHQDNARDGSAQSKPTLEAPTDDEVEVVRAKKIKLPGIKVVGKIDLPEVPQKQKPAGKTEDTTPTEEQQAKEERPSHRRASEPRKQLRKKSQHARKRTDTQSLSYEEKLKRQQREEARKQRERKKREKEKKRQKYLASLKDRKDVQSRSRQEKAPDPGSDTKPRHKNPIKRFFEWLNGEYDSF